MGQILVWECERTGNLFRDKSDYNRHLSKLRRRDKAEEKERQRIAERDALDAALYLCESFAEVEAWLVSNWDRLQRDHGHSRERSHVKSIRLHDMVYSDEQSNTHSAPRGGETNWHRHPDKPRGYPGWYGRISVDYTGHHRVSDVLQTLNVCTGSGGCGSFDVKLWSGDFKNLHLGIMKQYPALSALIPEEGYRIAAFLHDVEGIDRLPVQKRAHKWYDLEKKINHLAKSGIASPFKGVEDKIDRLARVFGETPWRYYVGSRLERGKAELYEGQKRRGHEIPILPVGDRMWQMREFLMEDSDMAVEWKLRGDIPAHTEIIDLKKRAERLLLEGKITGLSPEA